MIGERLISWPVLGGGLSLLCGLFFCYPYFRAVSSGVIRRKGALDVWVHRNQDPDAFGSLLKNRATHLTQGLILTLAGVCVLSIYALAWAGVEPARGLAQVVNSLAIGTVFGLAIISSILFSLAKAITLSVRAGTFGLKHAFSAGSLGTILGLIMLSIFFFGWFAFPDAPYRPCAGPTGYCGKQGQPHTAEEYAIFSVWEPTLFFTWIIGIPISLFLNRGKSKPGPWRL